MNSQTLRMASVALFFGLMGATPITAMAGEDERQVSQQERQGTANESFHQFQKESESGLKMDGDRGAPGINSGGQVIKPGEGEQDGRPGTIFGGPASLPPQGKALQYEGANKGQQTPRSTQSEASVPY